jgi:ethanolamine utilization microcompartment shell protein EutL
MRTVWLPVDAGTKALADRAFGILLALPTVVAFALGLALRMADVKLAPFSSGFLTVVVLIGVAQLAIVAVGRAQWLSAVRFRAEVLPRPPENEPGVFHAAR